MQLNGNAVPQSWEDAVRWLRAQPDQQQLVLDGYYDDPLLGAARRYHESEEWRGVCELLGPGGGRALEIGAGRGIASYALARSGYTVTALEPDPSELVGAGAIRSLAAQSGLPIEVVTYDAERLPFSDRSFDLVLARAVLHHCRSLDDACREIFRVLKPGGIFLALREHVISRRSDLGAFLDAHPLHRLYGGEHAYLLSEYRGAIEGAGFRLDRVVAPLESPVNFAPYTLATLQAEIAHRVAGRMPAAGRLATRLLGIKPLWSGLLPLLTLIDHRPGRLYSFRCIRPL